MNGPVLQKNNKSELHCINNLFSNGWFIWQLFKSNNQRKHLFRWIQSLKQNYLFDTPSPWLVFDAIDWIKPHLFKGMNVFEYGSGGSTLFWLYYGANVVSIEHNPQWYDLMKNKLLSNKSIDYRLIVPEITKQNALDFDPSDPEKYCSIDNLYRDYQFRNYVTQIDSFPDEHFDLILIDGRARPSCIKHSTKKIKVGGQIILDNSDRDYYFKSTDKHLENFLKIEFCGAAPENNIFSKTNIYVRLK
jgi:hypothetical protein